MSEFELELIKVVVGLLAIVLSTVLLHYACRNKGEEV